MISNLTCYKLAYLWVCLSCANLYLLRSSK
jgi:hypothetical protein